MKDRIRLIMENEQMAPSVFADKLQIGRAVISHLLNGRNNPSLDVVTRILSQMPYINSDWLLTGNGQMYNDDNRNRQVSPSLAYQNPNDPHSSFAPDLFSQTLINPAPATAESEYRKENIVNQPVMQSEVINKEVIIAQKAPDKKISKIIIYYTDNTFESFNVDNRPL